MVIFASQNHRDIIREQEKTIEERIEAEVQKRLKQINCLSGVFGWCDIGLFKRLLKRFACGSKKAYAMEENSQQCDKDQKKEMLSNYVQFKIIAQDSADAVKQARRIPVGDFQDQLIVVELVNSLLVSDVQEALESYGLKTDAVGNCFVQILHGWDHH